MRKDEIFTFLNVLFNDRKLFINLNGTQKLFDKDFMLVYDALHEDLDLLSEVLEERLSKSKITTRESEKKKYSLKNRKRF